MEIIRPLNFGSKVFSNIAKGYGTLGIPHPQTLSVLRADESVNKRGDLGLLGYFLFSTGLVLTMVPWFIRWDSSSLRYYCQLTCGVLGIRLALFGFCGVLEIPMIGLDWLRIGFGIAASILIDVFLRPFLLSVLPDTWRDHRDRISEILTRITTLMFLGFLFKWILPTSLNHVFSHPLQLKAMAVVLYAFMVVQGILNIIRGCIAYIRNRSYRKNVALGGLMMWFGLKAMDILWTTTVGDYTVAMNAIINLTNGL